MADAPQRMDTAPKDGTRFLAWYQKVKLDEDDNLTSEVVGGAWFIVSNNGGSWDEPADLDASGAYFFDDWSWAPDPVLWQPLPPEPADAAASPGVNERQAPSCVHHWRDFGSLGGRNVVWCSKCDALAFTGHEDGVDASEQPSEPCPHVPGAVCIGAECAPGCVRTRGVAVPRGGER